MVSCQNLLPFLGSLKKQNLTLTYILCLYECTIDLYMIQFGGCLDINKCFIFIQHQIRNDMKCLYGLLLLLKCYYRDTSYLNIYYSERFAFEYFKYKMSTIITSVGIKIKALIFLEIDNYVNTY